MLWDDNAKECLDKGQKFIAYILFQWRLFSYAFKLSTLSSIKEVIERENKILENE